MTTTNRRRLSDQIPLGVECALPQMSSSAAARPEAKRLGVWSRLALVVSALAVVAGVWMLGKGL